MSRGVYVNDQYLPLADRTRPKAPTETHERRS